MLKYHRNPNEYFYYHTMNTTSTKAVIRTRKISHYQGGKKKTSYYKYKIWLGTDDNIVSICNEFGFPVEHGSDCWEHFQTKGI